jgi:hypothetical protein
VSRDRDRSMRAYQQNPRELGTNPRRSRRSRPEEFNPAQDAYMRMTSEDAGHAVCFECGSAAGRHVGLCSRRSPTG